MNLIVLFYYWNRGSFFFSFECTIQKAWVIKENSKQRPDKHRAIYNYMYKGVEYAGTYEPKNEALSVGDTIAIEVLMRKPSISRFYEE